MAAMGIQLRGMTHDDVQGDARAPKFHNVKVFYKGQQYDSAGEAEYAWRLDQRVKAGVVADWERPPSSALTACPTCAASVSDACQDKKGRPLSSFHKDRITYRPDFYVIPIDGHSYYVDYKGARITETAAWRIKVKLWKLAIPFELRVAYATGEEKVVCTGDDALTTKPGQS